MVLTTTNNAAKNFTFFNCITFYNQSINLKSMNIENMSILKPVILF